MNCKDVLARFSDYRDECLSPRERLDFETHLADCPRCRRYGEVLVEGIRLLDTLPKPMPIGDLTGRVRHRVYRLEEADAAMRGGTSATTGATMILAVLLLGAAAWSPLTQRIPVVVLPAIVVEEPPPPASPFGVRAPSFPQWAPTASGGLLRPEHLYPYSHLGERYAGLGIANAGLE